MLRRPGHRKDSVCSRDGGMPPRCAGGRVRAASASSAVFTSRVVRGAIQITQIVRGSAAISALVSWAGCGTQYGRKAGSGPAPGVQGTSGAGADRHRHGCARDPTSPGHVVNDTGSPEAARARPGLGSPEQHLGCQGPRTGRRASSRLLRPTSQAAGRPEGTTAQVVSAAKLEARQKVQRPK